MLPIAMDLPQLDQELEQLQQRIDHLAEQLVKAEPQPVGGTPREQVYQRDQVRLYRYGQGPKPAGEKALLICYALVNRPYMLDLQPDRSLIASLVAAGWDVYLIDWGYPAAPERQVGLDDYVNDYLHHCVEAVQRLSGQAQVDLLGVCQGGTLSLCYAALHPDKIRRLITMVTPVDFHTEENLLAHMARHIDVDAMVKAWGNIPGDVLNGAFVSLQPFRLLEQKYVDLLSLGDDEAKLANFLRLERWIFDSPDQAGTAYREFIQWFYQQNALVRGEAQLSGRAVRLEAIQAPVLNIFAAADHLVPPSASKALRAHIEPSRYSEREFPGGHIGIYVGRRTQREVPETIVAWLEGRKE